MIVRRIGWVQRGDARPCRCLRAIVGLVFAMLAIPASAQAQSEAVEYSRPEHQSR